MDLSRLLHPSDPEWLFYGLLVMVYWAWTIWKSIRLTQAESKLMARWPSQAGRLHEICQYVALHRFSTLGKFLYMLVLLCAGLMIAMGYTTGTSLDGPVFRVYFPLTLATGAFLGLHLMVNNRLINSIRFLGVADSSKAADAPDYTEIEHKGGIFIGGALIALFLFLESCWLFAVPISWTGLMAMAN